jgi:hypothetical protein
MRPDGFTLELLEYNVYAFGADVRGFTRKRDAARKDHTRAYWQKRLDFASRCLSDNIGWLAVLESAALDAKEQR